MSQHRIDLDLWSEVIGQRDAVAVLRAALAAPVHAYLLVGPEGAGKRAAARAFAAELLAQGLDDAGVERARHLVGTEAHPSLHVVEREGATISVEQADEVVRQSSLAPPEGDRQVILMVDFHLIGVAAPKLLKSIEEPPADDGVRDPRRGAATGAGHHRLTLRARRLRRGARRRARGSDWSTRASTRSSQSWPRRVRAARCPGRGCWRVTRESPSGGRPGTGRRSAWTAPARPRVRRSTSCWV